MTKIKTSVTTYILEGDYMVDIFQTGTYFEAWLSHKDSGVKTLMFGADSETFEQFEAIVEGAVNEYIPMYEEEYMD